MALEPAGVQDAVKFLLRKQAGCRFAHVVVAVLIPNHAIEQVDSLALKPTPFRHLVVLFRGKTKRLGDYLLYRHGRFHCSLSRAKTCQGAAAITCNCTRLRVCSFSKYSRPFLTLT